MKQQNLKGIVKRWTRDKGYGFLTAQGVRGDIFVHISVVQGGHKSLGVGDDVTFDSEDGPKGPRATRVTLVKQISKL